MRPSQIVEAVLFASDAPLKADEIARADESLDEDVVEAALEELRSEYDESDRAFHVAELGEGYQILTRSEFSTYLERFDTVPRSSRLSGPALETLAIVAYRQPISRVEVEYIRGVASAGVLRTLQDRALIDVVGRGEGLGRPYLYGTTQEFLNHFGFRSLEELPRTEELPVVLRDPGPLDEMEDDRDSGTPEQGDLLTEAGDGDGGPGRSTGTALDGAEAGVDEGEGAGRGDEAAEESPEEAVARVLEGIPEDERDEADEDFGVEERPGDVDLEGEGFGAGERADATQAGEEEGRSG
ncbi:MAG: SMC-Scp complex subunit ScpB [Longimicrobiales bacterium]